MKRKNKIAYIISIILYGICAVFGGLAIIGILIKNPVFQIVGLILLVFSYLGAAFIEHFNKDGK